VKQFLLQLHPPIQYGGGNMAVYLEFHLKFGIHDKLRQNVTNHQILMRISKDLANRHSCQHIKVDSKCFVEKNSRGRSPNRK
jgi:hypothetical protein